MPAQREGNTSSQCCTQVRNRIRQLGKVMRLSFGGKIGGQWGRQMAREAGVQPAA